MRVGLRSLAFVFSSTCLSFFRIFLLFFDSGLALDSFTRAIANVGCGNEGDSISWIGGSHWTVFVLGLK